MTISNWMAWEAGVDVAGSTASGLALPNLILHVARVVHTPLGSAPAGLVLWQPNPQAAPVLAGFVCADAKIGAYFGPRIFAGTPFEHAPVLTAKIEVRVDLPRSVASRIEVGGHVFEARLSELGPSELVQRGCGAPMPFAQQGVEASAARVVVSVDGAPLTLSIPPIGLSGGPGAVWAPAGVYAR
ncbi:MAG: hypothetical protein IT454_04915 [Planctomycetes bacterium]|nr:hypothetical protein [Planctomycetota bacterium]